MVLLIALLTFLAILNKPLLNEILINNIFIILLLLVITFIVNYLILSKKVSRNNLNYLADIIISEVFNENKLDIEYEEDLKQMLKKLNNEKKQVCILWKNIKMLKNQVGIYSKCNPRIKNPINFNNGLCRINRIRLSQRGRS